MWVGITHFSHLTIILVLQFYLSNYVMIVILIENHYHYTISLAMLLWYLILHSHLQNQRPQILRISLEKGNIKLL